MTAHLPNKIALVTAGTDGVGKEVARGLALAGHSVVLVGRDKEKEAQVERELRLISPQRVLTGL